MIQTVLDSCSRSKPTLTPNREGISEVFLLIRRRYVAMLVDESEKGKLALNHFCRQAILHSARHETRKKKITLATSICGNTLLRWWM